MKALMLIGILSSVLRGVWAIEPGYARAQLPVVHSLIAGEYATDDDDEGVIKPFYVYSRSDFHYEEFSKLSEAPAGSSAIIPINGPVMKQDYCGSPGTITIGRQIREADAAPNISSIILDIDSPGGMVDGTATLAQTVEKTSKPVIAFVNDGMMASAAYWIGSGADHIIASQPTDMIGSIGVFTTLADYSEYWAKNGIVVKDIYSRRSTEKNQDYREFVDAKSEEMIKDRLDFLADTFIKDVRKKRKKKMNPKYSDPFKGRIYNANEALAAGLIDEIGDFERAVSVAGKMGKAHQKDQSFKVFLK